jgi:hypothetical protein
MMDIKVLWESFRDALVRHGLCADAGWIHDEHQKRLMDIGILKADLWHDLFTERKGRVWLPVTDNPNGPWRYYRIPGLESDYSNDLTEEILIRAAKVFGIDNELAGYGLQTAAELLDDDMLDI